MEATKINEQEPPTISESIFDNLMKNAKCDTGDDMLDMGFSSKWMNYEIDFYISDGEDETVLVEDFGFMKNDSWVQCEPTSEQMDSMKKVINNKLDVLYNQKLEEERKEREAEEDMRAFQRDPYAYYGVNRAMFF